MSEKSRIQHQLRYAVEGEAWHGPSVNEILAGMSAEQALYVPPGAPHSAWAIVLHITSWLDVVRTRLAGTAFEPSTAQDWPQVVAGSATDWKAACTDVERAYRELHASIGGLSDIDLERVAAGRSYNNYYMLHGVIQHTLYHAGQIILLKRMSETP